MAADTTGAHQPPPDPAGQVDIEDEAAWWSPLFHLTMYGLGWSDPARGLARWDQMGRPPHDPILGIFQRWWGDRIDEFLAFAALPHSTQIHLDISNTRSPLERFSSKDLLATYKPMTTQSHWRVLWATGSDPMHFGAHVYTPSRSADLGLPPPARAEDNFTYSDDSANLHAAMIVTRYEGWYSHLLAAPQAWKGPHDIRMDVVVRPLGWLGTYRKSRITGLWFRGRHRWHMLGNS